MPNYCEPQVALEMGYSEFDRFKDNRNLNQCSNGTNHRFY